MAINGINNRGMDLEKGYYFTQIRFFLYRNETTGNPARRVLLKQLKPRSETEGRIRAAGGTAVIQEFR